MRFYTVPLLLKMPYFWQSMTRVSARFPIKWLEFLHRLESCATTWPKETAAGGELHTPSNVRTR